MTNSNVAFGPVGWQPTVAFEERLAKAVRWDREHPEWVARVRSGAYRAGRA